MMLAFTLQSVFVVGVSRTGISVTVAHTSSSDTDILDTVVVPTSDGRIFFRDGHQMSEQGLCSE